MSSPSSIAHPFVYFPYAESAFTLLTCHQDQQPYAIQSNIHIPLGSIVWKVIFKEHIKPVTIPISHTYRQLSSSSLQTETSCLFGWQHTTNEFFCPDTQTDASFFFRHSCDPNCWFATDKIICATKDIKPGDVLTLDYGTICSTLLPPGPFLPISSQNDQTPLHSSRWQTSHKCLCGTKECRQVVTIEDWKAHKLRRRYGLHFRYYLLNLMQEEEHSRQASEASQQSSTLPPLRSLEEQEKDASKIIPLTDETRGIGKMASLHKAIRMRESESEGRGLFTTSYLPAGTVVWDEIPQTDEIYQHVGVTEYNNESDPDMKRLISYYYEMDRTDKELRYRGPIDPEYIERDVSNLWNHSCQPNCWFVVHDTQVKNTEELKHSQPDSISETNNVTDESEEEDDLQICLSRDIYPGEELVYDYCMAKPLMFPDFKCECDQIRNLRQTSGSMSVIQTTSTEQNSQTRPTGCRGHLRQTDILIPELRKKYGNHIVKYRLDQLAAADKAAKS